MFSDVNKVLKHSRNPIETYKFEKGSNLPLVDRYREPCDFSSDSHQSPVYTSQHTVSVAHMEVH